MCKTFYIIDDHEMLRVGTSGWLTSNSDWKCCGSAGTHEQAFADFERMAGRGELPLILICDLNFYGENTGFDFMSKIHNLYPEVKIIVYSMFFAAGIVQSAVSSGASGYVSKNASCAELLEGMEKVLAGEVFIQEELQTSLKKYNSFTDALSGEVFIQEELQPNLIKYYNFTDALTRREKEVMDLLLRRLSNDEIANELGIKKRAVENYISLIYEKTGVNDRSELLLRYGQ